MKNNVAERLKAFFFPPLCRVCNERQRVFAPNIPKVLCPDCLARWQEERAQCCPACGRVHADCRCMPKSLAESGCDSMVHLTAYLSHHRTAAAALILRCKDHNDRDIFRFFAKELAEALEPVLTDVTHEEVVITYVPRRRAAVRAKGHDHAKEMAILLGRECGLPCQTLLRRKANTQQQKQLDAAERERNAAQSFEIEPGAKVFGKTVLLIDDICTTGSSLAATTALLLGAGAARVVCAVIAKTERANS